MRCISTFYRVLNDSGETAQSCRNGCSISAVAVRNLTRNTQSGHIYELYNVNNNRIKTYLRPAGYLRPVGRFLSFFVAQPDRKNFFQKITKRWRLAGSKVPVWCHVGGKGKNHHIPHRKGVRRWKLSPATMANSAGLMLSAKPYCEMRPETTTGI